MGTDMGRFGYRLSNMLRVVIRRLTRPQRSRQGAASRSSIRAQPCSQSRWTEC